MAKCGKCGVNEAVAAGLCSSCGVRRLVQIARAITKIPHNGQNPRDQGKGKGGKK